MHDLCGSGSATAGSPAAEPQPALTCVKIVALVLQAQGPQALRVLIPVVCGHEDPVVVALAADIQGSVAGGWRRQRPEDRSGVVSLPPRYGPPPDLQEAREGPLGDLTPDGHECGARAHGAGEGELQVSTAAVGEGQLDLHVL